MLFTVRNAYRALVRAPALNLLVILSVGIGVGGGTTVFGWVEHLVRRPLPAVHDMDRLATVVSRVRGRENSVSYPDYLDWQAAAAKIQPLAAFGLRQFAVRSTGTAATVPQPVWGMLTTGNYFDVLGITPAGGRLLVAEDSARGHESAVAVISSDLASRWGGDPIGRQISVNDASFTVVGVAPATFSGTYAGLAFDLWIPLTMQAAVSGRGGALESRDFRWLQVLGRLREGVTMEEGRAELAAISGHLAQAFPENAGYEAFVKPLDTGAAQRLRTLFTILLGMTGLLAAIVCANVGNLLMLRGSARAEELRIRLSLGASPRQLFVQLLTESAMLAAIGAVAGVVFARYAASLLPALMPSSSLPLSLAGQLDGSLLLFAVCSAAMMVLAFGVMPAVQTVRSATVAITGRGHIGGTRSTARLRGRLVIAQLSLAMAALVCAAAFLRVNVQLASVDKGFTLAAANVFIVSTDLAQAGDRDAASRVATSERLLEAVRRIPGVESAALGTFVPLGFSGYITVLVALPGYVPAPEQDMRVLSNRVSPDYFATLGIALRQGRAVDASDDSSSAPVAVINEAFARRFIRSAAVVGQPIVVDGRKATIVGVVADGKYEFDALDKPSPPHVYLPYAQDSRAGVTVHARVAPGRSRILDDIGQAFSSVNPALPLNGPTTLEDYTSVPLFPVRLASTVLGSLGIMSLLLASTGLYGVLAYRVSQRRRELALRLALGASQGGVLRLIVMEAVRQALAGVLAGAILGLVGTRIIAARLPRITPVDPAALGVAAVLLLVVAVAAALIPAYRAVAIAPTAALK